ncbi:MAG: stage III sporulation protein AE [Clostridia bacterium]|nr:stage III sporulation protein AE [Clostridia bacterium]
MISSNTCYAIISEEMIDNQQEKFKIKEFIRSSEEYTKNLNIDINEVLNEAITGKIDNKKIFKGFGSSIGEEINENITTFGGILAIIIIHTVLKTIGDNLENGQISKLIYYVQYILIVTIIMSNFSNVVEIVKQTSNNLVGFINLLIPLLMTLMIYTGNITTSAIIQPIILISANFVGDIIQNIIIPIVLVFASLIVISKISDKVQIDRMAKFLKSGVVWGLGVILTIFVGIISLEGTLANSIDGITAKTAKAVVSSAIPVVGKILGDAVDTVLGCGIVLKNAIGIVGTIIIIGICIIPILKLTILTISYKLLAVIVQPIADKNIVALLEQLGDLFKIFLAIIFSLSFMLIIGITVVLKMSGAFT